MTVLTTINISTIDNKIYVWEKDARIDKKGTLRVVARKHPFNRVN